MTPKGFSLPEVLIAVAVAGIAASFMIGTLVRQQQFYGSASAILETRAHLRDAADVLATDIRGAAVGLLGLPVMRDSAIEMFTTIVASVVCESSSPSISIPPASRESGNTLTSVLAMPDSDDLAVVFTFPPGRPDSGQWETLRVASFVQRSVTSACPEATGFTSAGDVAAGATSFVVTFASGAARPLSPGAPIHFVRRARYSLYRSSDNKWYLGYRRCGVDSVSICGAIQPVSGPYSSYSSADGSGLSFRYYNEDGSEILPGGDSRLVSRVDITLRGKSARAGGLAGDTRAIYRDSVVVTVSPRNRIR